VLVLAIDTCVARGSVALLHGHRLLSTVVHDQEEDYSTWLLPGVDRALRSADCKLADVELFAVAAGPGSFTGIRIALSTMKAWNEVFRRPIAAVSRLEALAIQAVGATTLQIQRMFVAASCDAQRGQLYAAVYRRHHPEQSELERLGDEAVVSAAELIRWAAETAGDSAVAWSSLDPASLAAESAWAARAARGEVLQQISPVVAPAIGKVALKLAAQNKLTDALSLDANYIRRPDAEVKWKGYSRPAV
jgi:tRNA threonylcarbamoyladenosine biosynthesis protein TsaB